jgi:hypothetical protein
MATFSLCHVSRPSLSPMPAHSPRSRMSLARRSTRTSRMCFTGTCLPCLSLCRVLSLFSRSVSLTVSISFLALFLSLFISLRMLCSLSWIAAERLFCRDVLPALIDVMETTKDPSDRDAVRKAADRILSHVIVFLQDSMSLLSVSFPLCLTCHSWGLVSLRCSSAKRCCCRFSLMACYRSSASSSRCSSLRSKCCLLFVASLPLALSPSSQYFVYHNSARQNICGLFSNTICTDLIGDAAVLHCSPVSAPTLSSTTSRTFIPLLSLLLVHHHLLAISFLFLPRICCQF